MEYHFGRNVAILVIFHPDLVSCWYHFGVLGQFRIYLLYLYHNTNLVHMSKKLSDFPVYEKFPFYPPAGQFRTKKTSSKSISVIDNDSGEVLGGDISVDVVGGRWVYDPRKFTKVYKDADQMLNKLSIPALRVFNYIRHHLGKQEFTILVNLRECAEWCGYAHTKDATRGIIDLIDMGIIARKTGGGGEYYINPNILFDGDATKVGKWE